MTPDPTILNRTIRVERSGEFYLKLFDRMLSTRPLCRACGGPVAEDGMMLDTIGGPFLACWDCTAAKVAHVEAVEVLKATVAMIGDTFGTEAALLAIGVGWLAIHAAEPA